jgi:hypothetical protein
MLDESHRLRHMQRVVVLPALADIDRPLDAK